MPTNEFLPFANDSSANTLTQAEYQALADRASGMGAGLLPSPKLNKILRQSSTIAAAVAQAVVETAGVDMLDDGNVTTLKNAIIAALEAASGGSVIRADLASTAAGKGASLVSFENGKTVQDLSSTASGKGAALVGVQDEQTVTAQDLLVAAALEINILRYIPKAQWAAILAGTSSYDARSAIQSAINTGRPLYAPGVYRVVGSLDFNQLHSLRGDGFNGGATSGSVFVFESTGTSPAVTRTAAGATRVQASVTGIAFKAKSWDGVTGANGHGLDTSARLCQTNTAWIGFGKLGCYYHHDMTGNGPYESVLTNVRALYNGQHGLVVGRGANVCTLLNCEGKWNGASSYLTAPSVLGTYDGIVVDDYDDGTGWPSYTPEGTHIIGGDASYNARYGWSIQACAYGNIAPGYAEFNKAAYDANLGNDLRNSTVIIGRIPAAKVNMAAVYYLALAPNTVIIGGKSYGGANTNTAPQSDYSRANLRYFFSGDSGFANGVIGIPDPATGNFVLGGFGAGSLTLGIGASTDVGINANLRFLGVNTTGAGSAALGANCPATTATAPYTWVRVKTSDGSTGFIPIWK